MNPELEKNLRVVEEKIQQACEKSGRKRSEVELVAVTKSHPPETVREAMALGLRIFGESKVQEARAKILEIGDGIRWDCIGHLQTNKAKEAVRLFELIHSVDSVRLSEFLEKEAALLGKNQRILFEVNVSGEKSKFGIDPGELENVLRVVNKFPHLVVEGLMTMAPYSEDPEKARPYFKRLRELRDNVSRNSGIPLPHLSMGMSGDFEIAIEEGATLVRIGTAIFGERTKWKARSSLTEQDSND